MVEKCIENMNELIEVMKKESYEVPIIIGGIAASRLIAAKFTAIYDIPVYYGQDTNDAVEILQKALANAPIDVPEIKYAEELKFHDNFIKTVIKNQNFRLYKSKITDVVINRKSRIGCRYCSGQKKELCPLEIGYENQKPISESKKFINSFKFAVFVFAEIPNEEERYKAKIMWEDLIKIEQYFAAKYNDAISFKLPITCPFCKPKDCKISIGKCMFPIYYRQLHEQYNINITETIKNIFGDGKPAGSCAIILVR